MRKIFYILILLFSIYIPSISQIDGFEKLSINRHYFPVYEDSLVISIVVKASADNSKTLRCKALLKSNSYKIDRDYYQEKYEFELLLTDSVSGRFGLSIPVGLLKSARYSLDIIASNDNWQSTVYYSNITGKIPPVTIGKFGLIRGYGDLSVSDDSSKFTFVDFDNSLDITSNKLEGVYTQGFCNDELVSFNGFKFHLWKDKSMGDIDFSLFYKTDDGPEKEFSQFKISDTSLDGELSYNNGIFTYPFYLNENIEDFTIEIGNKINDLLKSLDLSDDAHHNLSFRFVIKAGEKSMYFPKEGKLSYDFKVYDLPTGPDCQAALLPIDLLKWETHLKKKIVYFEWTTVSEVNNNFFEIQKSNNLSDWKTIATLEGNGTTNQTTNYSALDKFPFSGQNYYRLRQSDFDGNFKYSKVKSVYIFDNKIDIFPNPAKDYIYYSISDYTKEFKVEIFDIKGRLVSDFTLPLNFDRKNIIDISYLEKGTYFFKYYNLETHRVQIYRFIKL